LPKAARSARASERTTGTNITEGRAPQRGLPSWLEFSLPAGSGPVADPVRLQASALTPNSILHCTSHCSPQSTGQSVINCVANCIGEFAVNWILRSTSTLTSTCTDYCTVKCSPNCSSDCTGKRSRHCSVQCSTQCTGHCRLQCVLHCTGESDGAGGLRVIPPVAELWSGAAGLLHIDSRLACIQADRINAGTRSS
jgi:hypothetical protein